MLTGCPQAVMHVIHLIDDNLFDRYLIGLQGVPFGFFLLPCDSHIEEVFYGQLLLLCANNVDLVGIQCAVT